jgi:hypothetical protein
MTRGQTWPVVTAREACAGLLARASLTLRGMLAVP